MPTLFKHISRYTLVGLVCVGLNNIILIAGDQMGFHYAVLTLVCFILVGAIGYAAHASFTFEASWSVGGYTRYLMAQGMGLAITLLLLFLMVEKAGWPMWVCAPVVTILMFFYHFVSTRWAVLFKRSSQP